MPALFLYLLKLSISLSITWLFYRLVLRGLTFYRLNRCYLLGYTLLSFFIPFIDIGPIASDTGQVHQPVYIQLIPVVGNNTPTPVLSIHPVSGISTWSITGLVLLIGIVVLLIRTLLRGYSLARITKQARLLSSKDGIRIYEVDRPVPPFSFGNAIYINPRLHSEKEWAEIILHEYVHIRHHHTFDILLAEIVTILNWYNPFAWALRHSIRQNLEFIADQQVLDKGVDKKEYQYHLLNVMDHPGYRLANNFNFSSLKKRIIMMNKMRSARLHLLRFLFLLPLLAVILLAFRNRYPHLPLGKKAPVFVNAAGIVIGLPSKDPLAGVVVDETYTGLKTITDDKGYFKLHIPASADPVRIRLVYAKQGFESTQTERYWPSLKQTTGMVEIGWLNQLDVLHPGIFVAGPDFSGTPPADPGYSEAATRLKTVLAQNVEANKYLESKRSHLDVGLFYKVEGVQRYLVVHTDGSVERFGYPGDPTSDDMIKKYGFNPLLMYASTNQPGKGYLDRWAAISAQAEKEFHPTGGNPKAIIFPGDSRVIVVSASGQTRFYDMDNTRDANERPEFEKRYGKLPPCVPANGTVTALPRPSSPTDTIPGNNPPGEPRPQSRKDSSNAATVLTLPHDVRIFLPREDPIYIIDGRRMSDSVDALQRLNPNDIASIQVLKSEASTARYGPEASRRGVILITLKDSLDGKKDSDPQKTQKQP